MRRAHLTLLSTGSVMMALAGGVHCWHAPDWSSPEAAATFRSSVVADHGWLSLDGVQLVDAHGEPVVLRGISLHGQQWFPATPGWTIPAMVRMFDINVVRVPVYVEAINPEDPDDFWGGYEADPDAAMRRLRSAVSDALSAGVYVIIDWHLQGDPEAYQAEAADFFERISAEYGHHPNVIYEIANEPAHIEWGNVRQYAEAIIPLIRAHAPDSLILVGTPDYSTSHHAVANDPLEHDNIMYVFHYYAATQALEMSQSTIDNTLWSGLPVFVSEWAATDAKMTDTNYPDAEAWHAFMEARQVSWTTWSMSNKDEPASLLRPDAQLSGPWTERDLSDNGRWMLPHLRDPQPRSPGVPRSPAPPEGARAGGHQGSVP